MAKMTLGPNLSHPECPTASKQSGRLARPPGHTEAATTLLVAVEARFHVQTEEEFASVRSPLWGDPFGRRLKPAAATVFPAVRAEAALSRRGVRGLTSPSGSRETDRQGTEPGPHLQHGAARGRDTGGPARGTSPWPAGARPSPPRFGAMITRRAVGGMDGHTNCHCYFF